MKVVSQRELRTLFRILAAERGTVLSFPAVHVLSRIVSGAPIARGRFTSTWEVDGEMLHLKISKRYGAHAITVHYRR